MISKIENKYKLKLQWTDKPFQQRGFFKERIIHEHVALNSGHNAYIHELSHERREDLQYFSLNRSNLVKY